MSSTRTLALTVAIAFLLMTAGSALAGPPAGRGGGPAAGRGPASSKGVSKDVAKKAAKKGNDNKGKNAHSNKGKNAHSNKGGQLRGLDRADQVAGEHGKQGRDKARAKQAR